MKRRCQCYKSINETNVQCSHPAKDESDYCGIHKRCNQDKINFKKVEYLSEPLKMFEPQMKAPNKPLPQPPKLVEPKSVKKVRSTEVKESYFKSNNTLPEPQKRWCRCILHVGSQQSDKCLENMRENVGKVIDGKKCYNIYAICSSSVGTSSRQCGINYDFTNIPDNELIAYAIIKKVEIPKPYSRPKMIKKLIEWQKEE